jgi:hypothetical protein
MTEAIQSDRNNGSPSGAQADTERLPTIGSATGILIISATRMLSSVFLCGKDLRAVHYDAAND